MSADHFLTYSAIQNRKSKIQNCGRQGYHRSIFAIVLISVLILAAVPSLAQTQSMEQRPAEQHGPDVDYWSMLFVFALATFIGLGIIRRVSRLLHTPLMSLTNAISAIAVVGSIVVTGADYPPTIRLLGAVALFASVTNIVSGFLITDRMLRMFKKQ
jgi:NAD(P) transhydrogenase subunit alpha